MARASSHLRAALSWSACVLAGALLHAAPAGALDAIELEVREVTIAGVAAADVRARLDVLSEKETRLSLRAESLLLPQPAGRITQIAFTCDVPVIAEPRYGCDSGRLTARGGPTGAVETNVKAELRTDSGVTQFSGNGLKVAGTSASFDGSVDAQGWRVGVRTGNTTIPALRKFAEPWFKLPADLTISGQVSVEGALADRGKGMTADVGVRVGGVEFTNEAGDIAGEKVQANVRARLAPRGSKTDITLDVEGAQGQAFLSIIFLDLAKNPLTLAARGSLAGNVLSFDSLHVDQRDLLDLRGTGSANLAGDVPAVSGDFTIARLQFPAAYSTYLANLLASSMLGDLATSGSLTGELSLADSAVTRARLLPKDLDLRDNKGRFFMSKVTGDVHWAGGVGARIPASRLAWTEGGAYGLSGGAAELNFISQGASFALTQATKLPVLDGAIAIDTFAMSNLGADNMEVAFKGRVEPISMPLLAKAFGWPEFSGTLAAAIPGVTLKDNVLTFAGNVEAEVFGGRIVGSDIRLQDPLGRLPRFFADFRARNLDLELVTRTFEVGSITGRLDADVLGLELFAWAPEKFDARLATPPGDKSRHRISAKAVSSLSNVGGGGGGVVQALQSGVLKFFDEYSYEKLGITCKLRNYICEMSGVEPAGVGYYIVKGSGLPRIDIIGNSGRVDWPTLVSQITTTEFSGGTVK
jgi:hypothetical protein